ncbi:MAG TPA: hypothetical protein VFL59_11325 [Candidatus Nanopelagicales bacterium]|nr:hypothetical protein [Candidatus Nanopelagicales bacterium]
MNALAATARAGALLTQLTALAVVGASLAVPAASVLGQHLGR